MKYSWIERRRIDRRAKAKLGLIKDIGDFESFMDDCIGNLTDEEDMDEDQATEACQILWENED